MSKQTAIILTEPVRLGSSELRGQVLVPVVTGLEMIAPSKKKPNYRVKLEVAFGPECCPMAADVTWLAPGPKSRLQRAIVLLEFEPETLVLPDEEGK